MQTVHDLLESIQKIDIESEVEQSLYDTRDTYVALQKEQLIAGKRSDGKNIFRISSGSDKYSPGYAKYKGKEKPIDLYDKGDLSSEVFMDVRDKELFIDSADPKSGMLQKDYGEEIFGLEDRRGEHFAEQVGVVLIDRYESKTQ